MPSLILATPAPPLITRLRLLAGIRPLPKVPILRLGLAGHNDVEAIVAMTVLDSEKFSEPKNGTSVAGLLLERNDF